MSHRLHTARAKGLGHLVIWRDHIVRNAILPMITILSLYLGHLLGG